MKLLEPGTEVDGFTVLECIHAGGMAHITAWNTPWGHPTRVFRWP
jgi:hypothetical protein